MTGLGAKCAMEDLFWSLKFRPFVYVLNRANLFRISIFLLKSARCKHLTLCQIITYKKQTPKFSTIQAIWRTIGAISRVIRDNSRAIQEQFETIGAMAYAIVKSRPF
jgi:hypothetical protein